jgi:hypothetical protein
MVKKYAKNNKNYEKTREYIGKYIFLQKLK